MQELNELTRESEEIIENVFSIVQSIPSSDWLEKLNSDDFKLYTRTENNKKMSVSICETAVSAETMITHACDDEITKHLDQFIEKEEVLETLSNHLSVVCLYYRGLLMISGRYFMTYRYWKVLDEGKYIVCWWDVTNEKYPIPKRKVKGSMLSAYIFENLPQRKGCKATLVTQIELGGSIPSWCQDIINSDIPWQLQRMGKMLSDDKYECHKTQITNEDILYENQ
ncbi:hypothetical protein WA158_007024 [Blastocystis sp. Blastoise]